jgi:hypothetical protein
MENALQIIKEKSKHEDNEYFGLGTSSSPRKNVNTLSKSFHQMRKSDTGVVNRSQLLHQVRKHMNLFHKVNDF